MTFAGVKTPLRKRFGLRVKTLRLATGLSQEAFADRCGFARSYMSRIERGGANPSLDAIETLADALGIEVATLFANQAAGSSALSFDEVPFAEDGSYFSRSTIRSRKREYNVGGKGAGNIKRFKNYDEALAYLRAMTPPKWWRPNEKGDWGLVTGIRWGKSPDDQENR